MNKITIESFGDSRADAVAHALRVIACAVAAGDFNHGDTTTTSSTTGGAELKAEIILSDEDIAAQHRYKRLWSESTTPCPCKTCERVKG